VASNPSDEGFHEIQLNGKQLVFLFMAATVVSVVIFLCGVLVGRGVRAERSAVDATTAAVDATPQQPPSATATPAGSDPTAAAPPPAVDELSYFNRLEKPNAPPEHLKTSAEKAVPAEHGAKESARVTPSSSASSTTRSASAGPVPSPDSGYAVQIAALNVRSEADEIARRLSSKGYSAYVLAPASGTPSVYRVRVGKFNTRREAESVAAKLQKEEQFKPWITR
jgi:cell division septation protein DedD